MLECTPARSEIIPWLEVIDPSKLAVVFPVAILATVMPEILDSAIALASTKWHQVSENDSNEIWSITIHWESGDPRLDIYPMMSSLWPTIGMTVIYALGSGILLRGKLSNVK